MAPAVIILRLAPPEVVGRDRQLAVLHPEELGDRVLLVEDQPPAWLERRPDDLGPARDVGQPDERPAAGVDHVERLGLELGREVVDVGGDEMDSEPGISGLARRDGDLRLADVRTGRDRTRDGPGQRILAGCALEVQQRLPGYIPRNRADMFIKERTA